MRRVLVLALLLPVAGCLDFEDWLDDSECRAVTKFRWLHLWPETDPRQPIDLIAWREGRPNVPAPDQNLTLIQSERTVPDGWRSSWTDLDNSSNLRRLRLEPKPLPAAGRLEVDEGYRMISPECDLKDTAYREVGELAVPSQGDLAQPGRGVWVHTIGMLPNGTVFYSTLPRVTQGWEHIGWYQEPASNEPLRVYVYDQSPSERPDQWKLARPRETDPFTNAQTKMDYVPTIRGFNEALKGLSTHTTRVVHVPPELAYTAPAYEGSAERPRHRLYGETLIFYVHLVRVVDLPCPAHYPELTGRVDCQLPNP